MQRRRNKSTRLTVPPSPLLLALLVIIIVAMVTPTAQLAADDVYLTLEEAPRTVFPNADSIERQDIQSSEEFKNEIRALIGRAQPSVWEPYYITFVAKKDGEILGYAVVCEEIGKHRPITFITAIDTEGKIIDVAVMMYREAYGGEVRYPGFTRQFRGKSLDDPIAPRKNLKTISGATLSSRAMARGVRKALAVLQLTYLSEPNE